MRISVTVLLLAAFCPPPTMSHHVLFFHNLGTRSHLITMKPLMQELLDRGHMVTSIIFSSVKISHQNYTEIILETDLDSVMKRGSEKLMKDGGVNLMDPSIWIWTYNMYSSLMKDLAMDMIKPDKIQTLLKSDTKIDAVIALLPASALLADIFDCPIILFSPAGYLPFTDTGLTNVFNPSVQPLVNAPFIEPMTLANRLVNHALQYISARFIDWLTSHTFSLQQEFLTKELGLEVAS